MSRPVTRIAGAVSPISTDIRLPVGNSRVERDGIAMMADGAGQTYREDNYVIAGDVTLCEREALCRRLNADSHLPDLALVLKAYRQYGNDCASRLLGDFAFAISNGEHTFCARDHLGARPLAYQAGGDQLLFVSDAPAVAAMSGAAIRVERIADFLVYPLEHVDHTSTCYRDVYRLPPASTLVFSGGQARVSKYWRADPELEVRFADDSAYVEAFSAVFRDAIRDRLRGVASAGCMLSGGVDSSAVIAFADEVTAMTSYSTIENDEPCDETRFIRAMNRQRGSDAVTLSCGDATTYLPMLLDQIDNVLEPFDHYMVLQMLLNTVAVEQGHQVMLDGMEGDMLHSLPSSYPSGMMREGELFAGLREMHLVWKNTDGQQVPLLRHYLDYIRRIGLPNRWDILRRMKKGLAAGRGPGQELSDNSLINPEFAREARVRERLEEMSANLYPAGQSLQQRHAQNIMHPAIAAAAERYDRVAALSGLLPVHPLMDKRLVEFSLGLPRDQKNRNGYSKYQLRRLGAGRVPGEVSWRVGWDENAWRFLDLVTGHYRDLLRERVADNRALIADFVRPETLHQPRDEDLIELSGLICWMDRNTRCH